ncbi:hypothetical protein NL676_013256 [Syzygium grande]|nr:hypothetical protein NL676_013256 [Syzygium grande]
MKNSGVDLFPGWNGSTLNLRTRQDHTSQSHFGSWQRRETKGKFPLPFPLSPSLRRRFLSLHYSLRLLSPLPSFPPPAGSLVLEAKLGSSSLVEISRNHFKSICICY